MEVEKIVDEFCGLLTNAEKYEIFSFLLEYSSGLDRLAFLFNRAEEYKLVLRLTQKEALEYFRELQNRVRFSLLIGFFVGGLSACLFFLFDLL